MNPVIMLSVFHEDPKGKERILTMPERLKPDIITVENSKGMSKYFESERFKTFRCQLSNILKTKGLNEKELILFDLRTKSIATTFEVQAAQEYCKNTIPFYLIDLWDKQETITYEKTEMEAAKNNSIEDIVSTFNLEDSELRENIDSRYRQIMLFQQWIPLDDVDVGRRDEFMKTQLRKIMKENPNKTIVHIGGAKHSLDDPYKRTLYSKIKDLAPKKHLLIEAD